MPFVVLPHTACFIELGVVPIVERERERTVDLPPPP